MQKCSLLYMNMPQKKQKQNKQNKTKTKEFNTKWKFLLVETLLHIIYFWEPWRFWMNYLKRVTAAALCSFSQSRSQLNLACSRSHPQTAKAKLHENGSKLGYSFNWHDSPGILMGGFLAHLIHLKVINSHPYKLDASISIRPNLVHIASKYTGIHARGE